MIRALREMQSCCLMVHSLYSSMTDEDLNVNEETKQKQLKYNKNQIKNNINKWLIHVKLC